MNREKKRCFWVARERKKRSDKILIFSEKPVKQKGCWVGGDLSRFSVVTNSFQNLFTLKKGKCLFISIFLDTRPQGIFVWVLKDGLGTFVYSADPRVVSPKKISSKVILYFTGNTFDLKEGEILQMKIERLGIFSH
ncbi:hypothetical protein A2442_01085 [Candidatus Campbellbacteria bacterium RIFOXYC2_FULL_35_25]|uniref:Uncharacterized protein n=1 Tax=Candidatus Campbellbacteria bacterium RIFOXYC2_FULL_35_25 TaxID=1797582 RepID=A0A1F5EJE9_9BACT|nr:MAG: hypothetical protein A2442_01085 [Candidatus Campbellbacteria bacterium RIFOXYC2_FULL_35_25]